MRHPIHEIGCDTYFDVIEEWRRPWNIRVCWIDQVFVTELTIVICFCSCNVLSIKTAFNLVKIHLLSHIIPLIQWSLMFCRPCFSCCLHSGIINHEKIKGNEYIHVTKIIIVQYFFPYELHENHEMKLSCTIPTVLWVKWFNNLTLHIWLFNSENWYKYYMYTYFLVENVEFLIMVLVFYKDYKCS
jgi:hypothetical protein